MKKHTQRYYIFAFSFFAAFILWTLAICRIDVQPIGPQGSSVGFAALNRLIHNLTGVHMWLYTITDWLGLASKITNWYSPFEFTMEIRSGIAFHLFVC